MHINDVTRMLVAPFIIEDEVPSYGPTNPDAAFKGGPDHDLLGDSIRLVVEVPYREISLKLILALFCPHLDPART